MSYFDCLQFDPDFKPRLQNFQVCVSTDTFIESPVMMLTSTALHPPVNTAPYSVEPDTVSHTLPSLCSGELASDIVAELSDTRQHSNKQQQQQQPINQSQEVLNDEADPVITSSTSTTGSTYMHETEECFGMTSPKAVSSSHSSTHLDGGMTAAGSHFSIPFLSEPQDTHECGETLCHNDVMPNQHSDAAILVEAQLNTTNQSSNETVAPQLTPPNEPIALTSTNQCNAYDSTSPGAPDVTSPNALNSTSPNKPIAPQSMSINDLIERATGYEEDDEIATSFAEKFRSEYPPSLSPALNTSSGFSSGSYVCTFNEHSTEH